MKRIGLFDHVECGACIKAGPGRVSLAPDTVVGNQTSHLNFTSLLANQRAVS